MKKNDRLLLLALLILGIITWGLSRYGLGEVKGPLTLVVKQKQTVITTLPLQKEGKLEIPTEHGVMQVQVTPQSVQVMSAPCPDKLCLSQGKITRAGQSIVCLPEQTVFMLTGSPSEGGAVDAILR